MNDLTSVCHIIQDHVNDEDFSRDDLCYARYDMCSVPVEEQWKGARDMTLAL